MFAVRCDHPGGPEVINIVDIDDPATPAANEVVVEVSRVALNGADVKTLAGWFPELPYPRGLGREFSGIVRKVGDDVSRVSPGDRVLGVIEPALQEYVVVPDTQLMPMPAGLSLDIACTLPVAGQTAWAAVESQMVQPGDVCIVSGASGGVGSIIVQLLINRGATVIALARELHHERLEVMGALPVAFGKNLVKDLRELTPKGIHHVFDQVGIPVIEAALALGVPRSQINSVSGFGEMFGVPHVGRVGLDEDVIDRLAAMIRTGDLTIATYTMALEDVAKGFVSHIVGSPYGKTVISTEPVDNEAMMDYLLTRGKDD